MNILVIEDNLIKREKVEDFIRSKFDATLDSAGSYNGGLKIANSKRFDLIILDMSMPTFDRTEASHGGRFRSVAGWDIAVRLAKKGNLVPFVVLTGYSDFSFNSRSMSIDDIDRALRLIGDEYKGCILFDTADSVWQDRLSEIITKGMECA